MVLVGLSVDHAGIVRVCHNGFWGTVCAEMDTPWSQKNSQLACERAGFAGAINPILHSTLVFFITGFIATSTLALCNFLTST